MTDTRRPFEIGFLLMPIEDSARGTFPRWTEMLALVRRAEEIGYDSVWIPDHLIIDAPRPGSQPAGAWEGWSLVAALAAATERIDDRLARRLHRLPQPRAARQDGRHGRRDQRRPPDPRARRRLARAGVPTPSAIPSITASAASRRRCRSSAGCCATVTSTFRGPTTRPATASCARAARAPRAADPRRLVVDGPAHAAAGRPLRRHLEPRLRRRQSRMRALFRRGSDGVPNTRSMPPAPRSGVIRRR